MFRLFSGFFGVALGGGTSVAQRWLDCLCLVCASLPRCVLALIFRCASLCHTCCATVCLVFRRYKVVNISFIIVTILGRIVRMDTLISCPCGCGHSFPLPDGYMRKPVASTPGAAVHKDVLLVKQFEQVLERDLDGGLASLGWCSPSSLYKMLIDLMPVDLLGSITQRRLSSALLASGWEWSRGGRGRRYRPGRR